MVMEKRGSAVGAAAEYLRALALSLDDGEFLGAEEELVQRLGISRPTLRQASAQVVQEHLISIRRGMGGGYFARRPESTGVSRIAALYLRSRRASIVEITVAMKPLRAEMAALAAVNPDPDLRRQVAARVALDRAEQGSSFETLDHDVYLRGERDFGHLLGVMSGNHVLMLMLEILYDFAGMPPREDVLADRPERVMAYRKHRAQLAEAVLDGDVELARLASHRCADLINEWIHEDYKDHLFDPPGTKLAVA